MIYDSKIAILIRDDLAVWQKLNVTAFLSGGLVGLYPELPGENYSDASGQIYGPLIRQPVMLFRADGAGLKKALGRALSRDIAVTVYTQELFTTGGDVENRAAVAAVRTEDLDLVGLAIHADRRQVDKVLKGFKLHD